MLKKKISHFFLSEAYFIPEHNEINITTSHRVLLIRSIRKQKLLHLVNPALNTFKQILVISGPFLALQMFVFARRLVSSIPQETK